MCRLGSDRLDQSCLQYQSTYWVGSNSDSEFRGTAFWVGGGVQKSTLAESGTLLSGHWHDIGRMELDYRESILVWQFGTERKRLSCALLLQLDQAYGDGCKLFGP